MSLFGNTFGHFKALVEIYPHGPRSDQRTNSPFNGIRWDFLYAEDLENLGLENAPQSFVYPEFLDQSGYSIKTDVPLVGTYSAKMHIITPHMVPKHHARLKIGTKFYCMEGLFQAAVGKVTHLKIE